MCHLLVGGQLHMYHHSGTASNQKQLSWVAYLKILGSFTNGRLITSSSFMSSTSVYNAGLMDIW